MSQLYNYRSETNDYDAEAGGDPLSNTEIDTLCEKIGLSDTLVRTGPDSQTYTPTTNKLITPEFHAQLQIRYPRD